MSRGAEHDCRGDACHQSCSRRVDDVGCLRHLLALCTGRRSSAREHTAVGAGAVWSRRNSGACAARRASGTGRRAPPAAAQPASPEVLGTSPSSVAGSHGRPEHPHSSGETESRKEVVTVTCNRLRSCVEILHLNFQAYSSSVPIDLSSRSTGSIVPATSHVLRNRWDRRRRG